MNIERAIRQYRENPHQIGLLGEIAEEIQQRLPALRKRAKVGLSPKALAVLRQYDDQDLLARLIERVVEASQANETDLVGRRRRRGTTYNPVDGKFDSYASDHIRRFVKSQMKPGWIPLDKVPEVQSPTNTSNTLPMETIHNALEDNVMEAMNSVTKADAKTKILYAIDQMPPDAVSPANFAELCRQAGLSRHQRREVIRLTSERPEKYARRVREILGISQSSARKRVDRAVAHLSRQLEEAMRDARHKLKELRDPTPDPNRDPFFNE